MDLRTDERRSNPTNERAKKFSQPMDVKKHLRGHARPERDPIDSDFISHKNDCPVDRPVRHLTDHLLTWVEIDSSALVNNARFLKKQTGPDVTFCAVLKANAYGHGLELCARILQEKHAADWIGVNALWEASSLRDAGITLPIYVMGYTPLLELEKVFSVDARIVVYNPETILELEKIAERLGKIARVHLKIETGNNRQGIDEKDVPRWIDLFKKNPHVVLEGLTTHFANIEDTNDHSYSEFQSRRFDAIIKLFTDAGISVPLLHCANSAATMLFAHTHGTLVRTGIALYGLWPSDEVKREIGVKRISGKNTGDEKSAIFPVLSWKTKVAQIKHISKGAFIGYGCSYQAKKNMIIAILPVGYYDGYDRKLSNVGEVLIHGKRARVCGRVCMNMIMVDITEIEGVRIEDTVTLVGRDGDGEITADEMAEKIGTIHYEVVTRIGEGVRRIAV